MSLYKQYGSRYWWTAIYIPGSAIGGKQKKYIRTSTYTEDKVKAAAIEQTIKLGLYRSAPAEQLHALIDALLGESRKPNIAIGAVWDVYGRIWETCGKQVKERTLKARQRAVERFSAWMLTNRPSVVFAGDVDHGTAADYADYLRKSGAKSKTRRNIITEISIVWRELAAVHNIKNPWPSVVPAVTDGERGKAFTRKEESRILQIADLAGYDWGIICRVARHTGLRYGDISRLTVDDVDQANRALRILPSKTVRHHVKVVLPLPEDVFNMLKLNGGPLFEEAFKCHPRSMWRYPFSKILNDAGLEGKGYTFHSWRHTFRTRLSEAGVSDDIAKRLGGWTQDATAERYDHAERIDDLRAAVESATT